MVGEHVGVVPVLPMSMWSIEILKNADTAMGKVELKGNASKGYSICFSVENTHYFLAQVRQANLPRVFKNIERAVRFIVDELRCTQFQMTIE